MTETVQPCRRCGYDVEADRQRQLRLGHVGHRMRAMLEVQDIAANLLWVCERCHAPGEKIQQIENRAAFPGKRLVA